jgi:hypothetical protein
VLQVGDVSENIDPEDVCVNGDVRHHLPFVCQ